MEELKNKMLLIGNTDYEAFCEELLPALKEQQSHLIFALLIASSKLKGVFE